MQNNNEEEQKDKLISNIKLSPENGIYVHRKQYELLRKQQKKEEIQNRGILHLLQRVIHERDIFTQDLVDRKGRLAANVNPQNISTINGQLNRSNQQKQGINWSVLNEQDSNIYSYLFSEYLPGTSRFRNIVPKYLPMPTPNTSWNGK
ncbi:MAG: hypothetical protein EZS28_009522 [Streblomastix strix]|uniref:Uncharacterized protein n=1 Tax=Streblomastix strix TaxID=222440 RepID=A0A5J4WJ77_9EUKA|nr:MAG: hypothetical protein EZS28_009522 [Streblomastix strix]